MQKFVGASKPIDYRNILEYSPKKKFFCVKRKGWLKCLGRNKGRQDNHLIDQKSRAFLDHFFKDPNQYLYQLLNKIKFKIPKWLLLWKQRTQEKTNPKKN